MLHIGAHGLMIVYNVTNRYSYDQVDIWKAEVDKHASANASLLLVGNHADLETAREVSYEEGLVHDTLLLEQ